MNKLTLPDLDSHVDVEIVQENIRAVAALYFIYQHERMGVFKVVERIAELYGQGLLPLGRGGAAEGLRALAASDERLIRSQRADLYEHALGVPGGGSDIEPNRDFQSLWILFVAEVLAHAKQNGPSGLVWPESPRNVVLRKAAADLAENLSLHGWGMANAAAQLAGQLRQMFDILRDPILQQAFGARDLWQVIERVNRDALGTDVDIARYWRLADAGRRIFDWLTTYTEAQGRATLDDSKLVEAAEAWLGMSGTEDDAIEPYSTPTESPTVPSQPVDLPAMAHDLLDALGLSAQRDRGSAQGGLVACFHGAPRTGKTLAAYVLAHALSSSIVRIDLGAVTSKYVGATEKHLAAAFYAAERVNAVLFFDEADALFGRHAGISDAHDRYANLDIGSLVERIEAYPGLVILATNLRHNIDEASAPQGRSRTWRVLRFPRTKR